MREDMEDPKSSASAEQMPQPNLARAAESSDLKLAKASEITEERRAKLREIEVKAGSTCSSRPSASSQHALFPAWSQ